MNDLDLAWEIRTDDVIQVLDRHGLAEGTMTLEAKDRFAEQLLEQHFPENVYYGIIQNVLHFSNLYDQVDAAASEIEDVLLAARVIQGEKVFHVPEFPVGAGGVV